jgi:hypothetical protein
MQLFLRKPAVERVKSMRAKPIEQHLRKNSRSLASAHGAVEALDYPADTKLKVAFAAVQGADDQVENDCVDSLLAFVLECHSLFLLLHAPQQLR